MNDKVAVKEAREIRQKFWREFDDALGTKNASKEAYRDELEELASEADSRLEAIREDIAREEE